ncbi:hypothetical protein M0804_006505 [Polistes exclamans]|nr:hypothetical protein M0804_006505 [Polistes exclamans]
MATIEDRKIDDRTIDRNDLENNLPNRDTRPECPVKDINLIRKKVENHHRTLKESTQERINVKKGSSSFSSASSSSSTRNRISSVKRSKSQFDKDIEFQPHLFTNSPNSSYSYLNKKSKINEPKKCFNCGEQHLPYTRYSYLQKYSIHLGNELNGVYEKQGTSTKLILANARSVRDTDSRLETPVTSLLYRSRSLPRLSVHDSGVGCSANEQTVPGPGQHGSKQLVTDLRQLLTLKQHYYPEGGWGWLVILVGMFVQILSHGTQGAVGVFIQHVATRFGHHVYLESG